MKDFMKRVTAGLLVALIICLTLNHFINSSMLETISISVGVTFYHFAMRLIVGLILDSTLHNSLNYQAKWFLEKPIEPGLYRILRVKKWKKYMPTLRPEYYDIRKKKPVELVGATCQAELVHEIIIVLSFLPIFLGRVFGETQVFVITSIVAAVIDLSFVMMQRFNRPRIVKLIKTQDIINDGN